MDSSDSLSNFCSDSTLSCSTFFFNSKAHSKDTYKEMDKEIDFNIEPYQYELVKNDGKEFSSKEENDIYKGRLDNTKWYDKPCITHLYDILSIYLAS